MSVTDTFSIQDYKDLYFAGYSSDTPDQSFQVTGTGAIKNVIKMYLMSQKGDYGRDVTRGGALFAILGKQITSGTEDQIRETILTAMANLSNIVVTTLNITRAKRGWIIQLVFTDTVNKFTDSLNLSITEASTS